MGIRYWKLIRSIRAIRLISIVLFLAILAPSLAHAFDIGGFLNIAGKIGGAVSGFSSIPGASGGASGAEVPVFNRAIEEIKKKEVGTRKISIPGGIGSVSIPFPSGTSGSLDGIAWQLGRMAINKITKDIVHWIKTGGRNGKPLFVENWEDFLKGVANEASGIFIQELELTELCKPFKPRIQLLIGGGGRSPYYQRARCTIEDVANNVERFYRNFNQGGWTRWFQITMVPQNNFYGAYYMSLEEKLVRESTALEAKQSEAIAGGGFLGQEECEKWKPKPGAPKCKRFEPSPEDPDDIKCVEFEPPEQMCVSYKIITPGKTIERQLGEVFGSDIRQLELADEIDEIIGAAFQRLLSNMRGKAINGKRQGITSPESINQFNTDTQGDVSRAIEQVSNSLELPQAIALAQQTASVKQDSISKINSLIGVYENIDSCNLVISGTSTPRITASRNNRTQIEKDITNINIMKTQLENGEQGLAIATTTDSVYQSYIDLKAAIDFIISLYDSAVAENNQIAGEITQAQQELDACLATPNE